MRDARSHRASGRPARSIAIRRAAVDVAAARNIAPRRTSVAKNAKQEVKDGGKTLVIAIDLTQDFGLSVSGNTDVKVGVNVYQKEPR